jgi:hypothetical protein
MMALTDKATLWMNNDEDGKRLAAFGVILTPHQAQYLQWHFCNTRVAIVAASKNIELRCSFHCL